jgi:hypothetical protein
VKTDGFRVNVRIFCSVVPTIQTISVTGILTVARTLHPSTVLAQVDGRIGVGTSAPAYAMDIVASSPQIRVGNSAGTGGKVLFR